MPTAKPLLLLAMLLVAATAARSQASEADSVKSIVNQLAANHVYERSATVGYGGTGSKQLKLYKELTLVASEKDLIELALKHESAVVRLYAFQALREKEKIIPKSLVRKFKADSTEVITLRGCFGDRKTVRGVAFEPIIGR